MNTHMLGTVSLDAHPHGRHLQEIMAAALAAADPVQAVRQQITATGDTLTVAGAAYRDVERLIVVGAGKAGAPMLEAAVAQLGSRISAGAVVVKDGHLGGAADRFGPTIELREAAHPVPDARSVAGAEAITALLGGLTARDLVLVLLSGGGSALLTNPAPGLTLDDLQQMTVALLRCGASIGEINALRKHCTRLFGGQLARAAAPARIAALIVSDVVGSPLDVIASGPTTADPTTFADAWQVVERYRLADTLPEPVVGHLRAGVAGARAETPKPTDPRWASVHNAIIASNARAAEAARRAAQQRGIAAEVLTTYLEGEAREVGRVVAAIARERAGRVTVPTLLIAGGETTVTLRGDGMGGRNQELALGAVQGMAGLRGALLAALATDGGDGPTDAAGAVVTGETLARAHTLGLDAHRALQTNDAYQFFAPLGDLLRPGPTLTNVNDLTFLLIVPD